MSQFLLIMSEQFTITLEQSFQASANSWQLVNNHELQIIADFVIIWLKYFSLTIYLATKIF